MYDDVLGLYFAQNRFYDLQTKRFTQEDPIKDGENWYVYVGANPLTNVDPMGLYSMSSSANYAPTPNINSLGNKIQVAEQLSRYTYEFINYIKSYETHTIENGIYKLSNGGNTIGYGHDLSAQEKNSGVYIKMELMSYKY